MSGENGSQDVNIRRELVEFRRMPYRADVFGGICAAIAYRLSLPTWLVRLVTFVLVFGYGFGLWVYLLLWIFVPRSKTLPADYAARTGHEV